MKASHSRSKGGRRDGQRRHPAPRRQAPCREPAHVWPHQGTTSTIRRAPCPATCQSSTRDRGACTRHRSTPDRARGRGSGAQGQTLARQSWIAATARLGQTCHASPATTAAPQGQPPESATTPPEHGQTRPEQKKIMRAAGLVAPQPPPETTTVLHNRRARQRARRYTAPPATTRDPLCLRERRTGYHGPPPPDPHGLCPVDAKGGSRGRRGREGEEVGRGKHRRPSRPGGRTTRGQGGFFFPHEQQADAPSSYGGVE